MCRSITSHLVSACSTDMGDRELRSSLQNLSDQSLKTSRHLDDTYYSILEKVSQLRQTIGSLQELSGLTKELHENFQSDTKELVEDIQGQFEGFNHFDDQQEQVMLLEARINAGKKKADALNTRLAEAKKRVDARSRSEAELEARNTRMNYPTLRYTLSFANATCRPTAHPLEHPRLNYRFLYHGDTLSAIQTHPPR